MTYKTIVCLLAVFLLSSCGMDLYCPAYKSALVLDEDYSRDMYSFFTVVDGDTVPKRPYGYKTRSEGDSLYEKFIKGTQGKGFRVQRGSAHSLEKAGFKYENRAPEKLWVKLFQGDEKPVLENPYLFDRLTKKKPFYKLDNIEDELIHFNSLKHDSRVREIVNSADTANYDKLMTEYDSKPSAIQAQHVPILRAGFNVEQEEYNKRYGDYFLRMPDPLPLSDSASLTSEIAVSQDTLGADTTKNKGFLGGLFKKGNKEPKEDKPAKESRRDRKNNDQGVIDEEKDN